MTRHVIKPVPLSRYNFKDFGEVVNMHDHDDVRKINYGMTKRFNNMACLDVLQENGRPLFNIFRSKPVELPFTVKVIERHPLSSQLFYPLGDQPFLVLVAGPGETPTPDKLKLFITNGFQGVNYKRNVWHHYLMAVEQTADFIVIDRGGEEKNCDEFFFTDTVVISRY